MNALLRSVSAIVAIMVALFSIPTALAQDVILRVDIANGSVNPTGFGDDWGSDAYKFLQDALDRANFLHATVDPELEIHLWIAEGTYRPDQWAENDDPFSIPYCPPYGDCDPAKSFNIPSNVQVFGGFAGTEDVSEFHLRNVFTNLTILSGDLDEDDVDWGELSYEEVFVIDTTSRSDNSRSVVRFINADATARIDGFTIRSGGQHNDTSILANGGGLHMINSSGVISNCRFTQNFGTSGGGAWGACPGRTDDAP